MYKNQPFNWLTFSLAWTKTFASFSILHAECLMSQLLIINNYLAKHYFKTDQIMPLNCSESTGLYWLSIKYTNLIHPSSLTVLPHSLFPSTPLSLHSQGVCCGVRQLQCSRTFIAHTLVHVNSDCPAARHNLLLCCFFNLGFFSRMHLTLGRAAGCGDVAGIHSRLLVSFLCVWVLLSYFCPSSFALFASSLWCHPHTPLLIRHFLFSVLVGRSFLTESELLEVPGSLCHSFWKLTVLLKTLLFFSSH